MGNTSITVKSDSLKKQLGLASNSQDTLVARARLSDGFGNRLFNLAKAYEFNAESHLRELNENIKGLALVPTESEAILGFRIFNNLSAVTIHYRTRENNAVKDTLTRVFGFNIGSFTNINVDRAASVLSGAVPYQSLSEFSSSGPRYIQSGNPVITKLDLANFYQFADTVGNVLVNEASLVIDGIESPLSTPAIGELGLKAMNENNQFINYALATDREAMSPYVLNTTNSSGVFLIDSKHFVVKSDAPTNPASIASLQLSDGKYSGYLTLFLQQLLKNSNSNPRLRYLGLYPLGPAIGSSTNRTIFDAANVRLRIYYTKPNLTITP
jgi:hypothetical protein